VGLRCKQDRTDYGAPRYVTGVQAATNYASVQELENDLEELLKQAVKLSSDRPSQRKRASFWRWQREFFDDKGITDQSAVQEAVEEMHDLLEEEKSVRSLRFRALSTLRLQDGSQAIRISTYLLPAKSVSAGTLTYGS
jgi:hypothetical protein